MIELAKRLDRIQPSPVGVVNRKAREMRAAGRDIVNLSFGAPDFDTPALVKKAAVAAIEGGDTRYTNVDGTPALKAAIGEKFRTQNELDYGADEITVGTGAKQVIFNAFMVTLNPGDEVIVPAPYYASYPQLARIPGGEPRIVPCPAERGFKLVPDALEAAITPRSRWLIINSPSNPSGAVYDARELADLAEVLRRHPGVAVLSDDVYEYYIYDGAAFATMAAVAPDLRARILTLNGVSKTYGMTGWRIGYAGGPAPLIRAIARIQSESITSSCSVSQAAAAAALIETADEIKVRLANFAARRDLILERLRSVPGLTCEVPRGSFYAYPGFADLMGRRRPDGRTIDNDVDLADYFLDEAGVSTVAGSAYGLSPHLRLSFAAPESALVEGAARMAKAGARLR